MINVTKPYLPNRELFNKYLDKIYQTNWLTNFGPLEQELTTRLKEYLEIDNLLLVNNGTIAMQVLYKALGLSGEVLTTPFSFVATTSTLVWEGLKPVFVDIDSQSMNMNPQLIESKISDKTSAILAVHVYGRACDVWEIQRIADQHNLKVVYDAAHAFNVKTNENKSIFEYGDASTISFHATKLFHTIEGGAIVTKDSKLLKECKKLINFGISGYDRIDCVGINAKMNEFSAAMGLAVLDNIEQIMSQRQRVYELYNDNLPENLLLPIIDYASNNYSYYPILLDDQEILLNVRDNLLSNEIMPRRYFYPSLNNLNYITYQSCPVSEDISKRILCLPMYPALSNDEILKICKIVSQHAKYY